MEYRFATLDDVPLLAAMNRALAEDEGHRNRFRSEHWFADRMRGFLMSGFRAVLFSVEGHTVAYALYADHPEHADTIHLRQLYVDRACRRQGCGREALRLLREAIWPREKRVTVEVLAGNAPARQFYRAVGFREYALELEMPAPGTVGP